MLYKSVAVSLFLSIVLLLIYDTISSDDVKIITKTNYPVQQISSTKETIIKHPSFRTAAAISRKSVVSIISTTAEKLDNQYTSTTGSGVIFSDDGYIITNLHVIIPDSDIIVVLNNKEEFKATLIGIDPTTDLALLKIDTQNLPVLHRINSDSIKVGDWILAVGNPLDLQSTVTAGIVSAKGRDINVINEPHDIESFIQTDAVMNQGNSGGALVDIHGNLVGINTAVMTHSGSFQGYSFAIPLNIVEKTYEDLKNYGMVLRGLLGIEGSDVDHQMAKAKGLKNINGIYVNKIIENGGASESNLEQGDIILKINNKAVSTKSKMKEVLSHYSPGDKVNIKFYRHGKMYTTSVLLKNRNHKVEKINFNRDRILENIGIEVRDLIQSEKNNWQMEGILVTKILPNSSISRTHMKEGFLITKVNDIKIKSSEQVISILEETKGRVFFEGIYKDQEGPFWYVIQL